MTVTAVPNPLWRPNTKTPPAFDIEVFNQDYSQSRPLGPYMKARFGWLWNKPGTATIQVKGDHPLAARLMACKRDVVPIRTYYNGIPWDGRVMSATMAGRPGEEVVTATCISNLFWIYTLLCWVNPILPPEVQIALTGKQDIMFGPSDFVFKYFLAKNAIRLDKPVYAALPLKYDVGELPQLDDLNSLDDILEVIGAFTNDLVILSARFTQFDELIGPTVDSLGIGLSCNLYLPKDGPSPWVFNTEGLGHLANLLDLSGDNIFYFTNPDNILGLADPTAWGAMKRPGYVFDTHRQRDRRWMQWRTDSGHIVNYERGVQHPKAHSAIVGGKAPEFVNQVVEWAANAALKALLNWLLPGAGLGDILVGDLFDDIFFAYQKFDDPQLKADLGPHAFGETFVDNTSAYNLDSFAVGLAGLKKMGGGESLKIEVQAGGIDGRGFSFGVDDGSGRRFQVGDIMTFWDRGAVVEDYVSSVEVEDSGEERCTEFVTIGDTDVVEDPWQRMIGRIKGLAGLTRAIANGTG
ncbi:Gp37-like protein [Nocardia niigatensis]